MNSTDKPETTPELNSSTKRDQDRLITDAQSCLTLINLHDKYTSQTAWINLRQALAQLERCGYFTESEIASLHELPKDLPEIILRRDRGLWEATVYFVLGEVVWVISIDEHLEFACFSKEASFTSRFFRDTDNTTDVVAKLKSSELEPVGTKTYVAVWVSRNYDTLQRFAQIRQLRDKLGDGFQPNLAINEIGNLFEVDLAVPFHKSITKVAEPGSWRANLSMDYNLCECLKFEWEHRNDFHQEMIAFVRSLAARPSKRAKPDNTYALLLSIEAEKRQMINQEAFFDALITRLKEKHKNLSIYFNGMTRNIEGIDLFDDVRKFEEEIIGRLSALHSEIDIYHLHNMRFSEKVSIYKDLDFFVCPFGSAAIIPQLLGVPGVGYNSVAMMSQIAWFLDVMPSNLTLMPSNLVRSFEDDLALRKYDWGWSDNTRHSYEIEIEQAVDFCETQAAKWLKR